MEEKDRLTRSRSGLMGVIVKTFGTLDTLKELTSVPELKAKINSIQGTLNKFHSVTNQLLDHVDAAEVESYFIENSEKESLAQIVIETLKEVLQGLQPTTSSGTPEPPPSTSFDPRLKYEVPKMNKFDGNPQKYQAFWDRWSSRYHEKSSIPDVDKLELLLQHLEGKALSAVSGLPPTSNSYHYAIQIISKRFGKRTPRIMAHVMAILNLPKGGEEFSIDQLRTTLDSIVQNVRALQSMGLMHSKSGDVNAVLGSIIFTRFPDSVCDRWCDKHMEDDVIDVESFLKFVEDFVSGREFALSSRGGSDSKKSKGKEKTPHHSHGSCSAYHASVEAIPKKVQSPKTGRKSSSTKTFKSKSTPGEHNKEKNSSSCGSFSLAPGNSSQNQSFISRPPCPFCGNHHYVGRCEKAKLLPSEQVINTLKESQRCLCCFNHGHVHQNCNFKPVCAVCGGTHLPLVCNKRTVQQVPVPTTGMHCNFKGDQMSQVLLQTATALVEGPNGSQVVRCLLDSASQSSFIQEDVAQKLGLPKKASPLVTIEGFGSMDGSAPKKINVYGVQIRSVKHARLSFQMDMLGIKSITKRPHSFPNKGDLQTFGHLQDLEFSDDSSNKSPIDVLIGADYYYDIVGSQQRKGGRDSPTAVSSCFGWILCGPAPLLPEENSTSVHFIQTSPSKSTDEMMAGFFSMESYGMKADEDSQEFRSVHQSFKDTVKQIGNRYQVELPWKKDHDTLLSTEIQAKRRFNNLLKRFQKDPVLLEEYGKVFKDYLARQFIEKVPEDQIYLSSNSVFYLPHHPVVRQSSKTTKVRPVFDASCKGASGVSLNDCLEVGPSLNPEVPDVLLRFRSSRFVVTSDIEKAFLQLSLSPKDRDVCRFFWINKDGEELVYRFKVVSFGIVSSPFLLRATISHHLSLQESSDVLEEMEKNFYVDNLCQSASTVSEGVKKAVEAKEMMLKAGMNLCQWSSNSAQLKNELEKLDFQVDHEVSSKFLGMQWDTQEDVLQIKGVQVKPEVVITKRVLLQSVASIFDPLGLISPIVVRGKLLLQKLWTMKSGWDDPVEDGNLLQSIQRFLEEISNLDKISIPRCPFLGGDAEKYLHVFCDSSSVASAVCVYLAEKLSQEFKSNLLISKTKVVPISFPEGREEDLRIPRKELVACFMGVKLGRRVADSLSIPISKLRFWTDSSICLAWIKNPKDKFPVFVQNRVQKIRSLSEASSWNHVSSDQNPADIPSRGKVSVEVLRDSKLWNNGPEWLKSDSHSWNSETAEPSTDYIEVLATNVSSSNDLFSSFHSIIDLSRFSSLSKAVKVAVFVLRAIAKWTVARQISNSSLVSFCNGKSVDSVIPKDEMDNALRFLIRMEQRSSFSREFQAFQDGGSIPNDSSLLRLRPTWDASSSLIVSVGREKPKVPLILLPKQSQISRLVLLDCHSKAFHGGVETTLGMSRERYWICNGRVITKQVVRSCPVCKIFSSTSYKQHESALPSIRTTPAPPFYCSGVDYAGPFYLRSNMKAYVLLFTCGVVRGVHLEVVPDMSTEVFVNAFRRFQARRMTPAVLFSDNAPTFKKASRLLPTINWRFIPEKSPWWGGFYERLVMSVKMPLKKVLGKSQISFPQFQTLIIEIENMINSRPLTIVNDDVDNPQPLTPNHFLKPAVEVDRIKMELQDPGNLKRIWNSRNRVLQHFWSRWKKEYLNSLRLWRQRRISGTIDPAVGDVVLMEVEGRSRIHWPLATVHSLIKGTDGHVRAAIVKVVRVGRNHPDLPTSVSFFRRPTRQLYHLESSLGGSSSETYLPTRSVQRSMDMDHQLKDSSAAEVVKGFSKDSQLTNVDSSDGDVVRTRSGRRVRLPEHLRDFKMSTSIPLKK